MLEKYNNFISKYIRSKLIFYVSLIMIIVVSIYIINLWNPDLYPMSEFEEGRPEFVWKNHVGNLMHFTQQVNMLGPIFLFFYSLNLGKYNIKRIFFRIITTYYIIMFFIYWGVLAPGKEWILIGMEPWALGIRNFFSVFTHGISPLVMFSLYLFDPEIKKINVGTNSIRSNWYYVIIYPMIYFLIAIILHFTQGISIYSFANFSNPFGLSLSNMFLLIFVNITIICLVTGAFILVFWALTILDNKLIKKLNLKFKNKKEEVKQETKK